MNTPPTAAIILANGFEEIEAISVIDILRRAQIDIRTLGLDNTHIQGAHGIKIETDSQLEDSINDSYDILILPGGEPGTTNLENSALLKNLLLKQHTSKKWIAAICAAPRILNNLNILADKQATSFPSTQPKMTHCHYSEDPIVIAKNIITSRGPGTAMLFGYTIVECLTKQSTASLRESMVYSTQP